MNRLQKEKGSAHVVVIVVLVVALIFALGWIFWQNFILKEPKDTNNKPVIVKQHDTATKTKTYTDKASGVSFDYPADWSVEPMTMSGSLMVTVKDSADKPVAYLETKLSGLGGARAGSTGNTLVASSSKTCAVATQVGDNSYALSYGTSGEDLCKQSVGATTGGGMVYMTTDTGKDALGVLSFSNIDYLGSGEAPKFSSLDAAKQYVASDTYKQTQAVIDSLEY